MTDGGVFGRCYVFCNNVIYYHLLLDNVRITPSSLGAPGPLVTGSEPSLPSQSSGTPLRRVRSGRVSRRTPYMVRRLRQ